MENTNVEFEQDNELVSRNYYELIDKNTVGPQIEGLGPIELNDALNDSSTKYIEIDNIKVPFLVNIKHAAWFNEAFLNGKDINTETLYYSVLPQKLLNTDPQYFLNAINEIKDKEVTCTVLLDYPQVEKPFYSKSSDELNVDHLITSNGTPAATFHFESKFSPVSEKLLQYVPEDNLEYLNTKEEVDANFERIWEIYSKQFESLVADHPINGALTKEDLYQSLISDNTNLLVYLDENSVVQSFGYIVKDLNLCPWLNTDYFMSESSGDPIYYMPGIATDPEAGLSLSMKIMKELLCDNLMEVGSWTITFECSNISASYIPKLVTRTLEKAGVADYTPLKEYKYLYEVVTF